MAKDSPISNILVLVDGSDASMKAAKYAIKLAKTCKADIEAVTIIDTETLRLLLTKRILVTQEMDEYEQELEQSGHKYLQYIEELAKREGQKIRCKLEKGSVHSVILNEYKASDIDLIVMGSFQSTMAKRDLIAKERQLVIDGVSCPVLLVK